MDKLLRTKTSIFIYLFIFFSIGGFYISFFPPDEPKYVDAALRMIENHNYIIPFFNCHVRFDKPILYYWELVLFFKLFFVEQLIRSGHDFLGLIEYAAKLPAIISASLSGVYVCLLSKRLFGDEQSAKLSVVGFISVLFFFYLGRAVYPDMSLILFELAGVYYFIENRYILGWLFTALAFLTKGPIGIVSVGFTYFLYLWIVKRSSGIKEFFSLRNGMGFLVFLIVSMPWYVVVYKLYGMEFINKFLIYHNIERFTGAAHQHPHSFFYFFPISVAAVYLWWPFLVDFYKALDFKNKKVIFLFVWFLWVFLFFSISKNKLAHYIAFGFIPLSVLFGLAIEKARNSKIKAFSMFVFEFILGVGLSLYSYKQGMESLMPTLFFGLFFVALTNILKEPKNVAFYKALMLSVVGFVLLFQFEQFRPEKHIWKTVISTSLPLFEYKINNQSITAYTRRCLSEVRDPSYFNSLKGKFFVYTKEKHLNELMGHFKILGKFQDKGKKTVLLLVNNG
ncbi:ArnT family glycosyltransferase [Hippea maritima]|uniref:ArnT family glycosyltransferase n=1 Tax=Hippea maritima TaxID=84405 RepID=UPI001FE08201|nr:glycosyltransferase family 39 protein [Hippea maritima]